MTGVFGCWQLDGARVHGAAAVQCVFQGRLDNRRELLRALADHPLVSPECPDQSLVLSAYDTFGEAFPERLEGEFVAGICNHRLNRLLLARDRLGMRPLCYARVRDAVIFASSARALLAYPGLQAVPDDAMLADFILYCPLGRRSVSDFLPRYSRASAGAPADRDVRGRDDPPLLRFRYEALASIAGLPGLRRRLSRALRGVGSQARAIAAAGRRVCQRRPRLRVHLLRRPSPAAGRARALSRSRRLQLFRGCRRAVRRARVRSGARGRIRDADRAHPAVLRIHGPRGGRHPCFGIAVRRWTGAAVAGRDGGHGARGRGPAADRTLGRSAPVDSTTC